MASDGRHSVPRGAVRNSGPAALPVDEGALGSANVIREGPGLAASLWRYRVQVVIVTLAAVTLGYLLSSGQAPVYEASARMYLGDPRRDALFGDPIRSDPIEYLPQQAELVTSRAVLERAGQSLPASQAAQLDEVINVDGDIERNLMVVTALGPTAELSAASANAVTEAYESLVRERVRADAEAVVSQLEAERTALQAQIDQLQAQLGTDGDVDPVLGVRLEVLVGRVMELESRVQSVTVSASSFGSGVDRTEEAIPPDRPVSPAPKRDAALVGLLTALLAGAWAYWLAGRPKRVRSRMEPANILGVPLLGEVPLRAGVVPAEIGDGPADERASEAFAFVLSSIEFALGGRANPAVLVTSAMPGAGKTVTSIYLGYAASRGGRRALLVDADLRGRALTHGLGLDNPVSLDLPYDGSSEGRGREPQGRWLFGEVELQALSAGRLIGAGTSSLRTEGFGQAFRQLQQSADLTVVDSSPLLAAADTSVLAQHVDGIVLVVRQRTPIAALEKLAQRLAFVAAPTLGYVYVTKHPEAEPASFASRVTGSPARPSWRRRATAAATAIVRGVWRGTGLRPTFRARPAQRTKEM